MNCRMPIGRQHGSTERKREGENGVLPFDHLQGDPQVVEERHEKIVKQLLVLGVQVSVFCFRVTRKKHSLDRRSRGRNDILPGDRQWVDRHACAPVEAPEPRLGLQG